MRNPRQVLRRARKEILEIPDPAEQQRVAGEFQLEVVPQRREAERQHLDCETTIEETKHIASSRWARYGSGFLYVAGGHIAGDGLAWYITTAVTVPQVPRLTLFLGCMVLAGLLSLFCHFLISPLLQDHLRVQRTVRRHLALGIASSSIAVCGFLAFMSVRGASPDIAERLMAWGWVPFLMMNTGLPIAASAFSSLGLYLTSHSRAMKLRQRTLDMLADLQALDEWLHAELRVHTHKSNDPGDDDPPYPPRPISGPRPAVGMSTPVSAAYCAGHCGTQNPQSRREQEGAVAFAHEIVDSSTRARGEGTDVRRNRAPTATTGSRRMVPRALVMMVGLAPFLAHGSELDPTRVNCPIALDRSASVSSSGIALATAFIQQTVDELVSANGCTEVDVILFADEGRWAPRVRLQVPSTPQTVSCADVSPEPLEGVQSLYDFFKPVKDARRARAVRDCEARMLIARKTFAAELSTFHNCLAKAMLSEASAKSVRTRITPILDGFVTAESAPMAVIVTDGVETPAAPHGQISSRPTLQIVMLLVPSVQGYASADQTLAEGQLWERTVRGLKAIPVTEAQAGLWTSLARRREGR